MWSVACDGKVDRGWVAKSSVRAHRLAMQSLDGQSIGIFGNTDSYGNTVVWAASAAQGAGSDASLRQIVLPFSVTVFAGVWQSVRNRYGYGSD